MIPVNSPSERQAKETESLALRAQAILSEKLPALLLLQAVRFISHRDHATFTSCHPVLDLYRPIPTDEGAMSPNQGS